MKMKELQEQIASKMKEWQRIENGSLVLTSAVMAKTENPLVRLVMEIIQRDSVIHYAIQQWIVESIEEGATILTYNELNRVWEIIGHHIDMEKRMVASAEEMLALISGKKMVLYEYLLNFLLEDERKHTHLLERLEGLKKGLLP